MHVFILLETRRDVGSSTLVQKQRGRRAGVWRLGGEAQAELLSAPLRGAKWLLWALILVFPGVSPPSLYRNSEFHVLMLSRSETLPPNKRAGAMGALERQSLSDRLSSLFCVISLCPGLFSVSSHTVPRHREVQKCPSLSSCQPPQQFPYKPFFWKRTSSLSFLRHLLCLLTSHLFSLY